MMSKNHVSSTQSSKAKAQPKQCSFTIFLTAREPKHVMFLSNKPNYYELVITTKQL